MKVYYAHPISHYDKPIETESLQLIRDRFCCYDIVNPNKKEHQDGYNKEGMSYFINLAKECDIIVAAPFSDGEFGMGVYKELEAMKDRKGETYYIWDGLITLFNPDRIRPLSIHETRRRIREGIK